MPPKTKSRRRSYRRRRLYKKGTKKLRSKSFKKAVQRIINRNTETKHQYLQLTAFNKNSGIVAPTDCLQVVPNIAQVSGVTPGSDYTRIGSEVMAKSVKIKGAIVYNPSTGQYGTYANARIGVRLMIVQPRNYSDIVNVINNAASWMPSLLTKGSSNVAFSGVLSDLWAPINNDAFITYYNKVMYMNAPYQVTAVGAQSMAGSTRLFSKTFVFKGAGKKLKYDTVAASGLAPINYCPVLLIGYCHMDGSAPDVLSTAIQISYDATINFKDA